MEFFGGRKQKNMESQRNIENLVKFQMETIKRGIHKIINPKELEFKIRKSIEQNKPLRVKLGIDPTAPDIHLGFAVVIRKLREFQDLGHIAVLIIGDFTAKIGDPSGRKATRPQLTDEEIKRNMETYTKQLLQILRPDRLEIRYNSEWLKNLGFKEIIKLASQVTLQQIIQREDFSKRLKEGSPLHLHEIIYPLLQAYDSVMAEADIELGGSDQEFNCLVGRVLQNRFGQDRQVVILMPLLIGLDGRKMSKSYGNYIGITENSRDMFGKTMSISDELIEQWFKLCTNLNDEEIKNILSGHPMEAKKRLAYEIVKIYHGEDEAKKAKEEFERVFQQRENPLSPDELILSEEDKNKSVFDILVDKKVIKSRSELRRLLNQRAIEINDNVVSLKEFQIYKPRDGDIIRIGKNRFFKIRIQNKFSN